MRVPLRLDVGGVRLRRRLAARLGRRPHREDQAGHGDHADARPLTGDDRGNAERHRLQDPDKWVPYGVGAIEGVARTPLPTLPPGGSTPTENGGRGRDGIAYGPGEEPSPLGELIAEARAKGSVRGGGYHGYRYRILTAQGAHAQGGAFDYRVKGHMIGGFAVVAWPVTYGETGVMTFMVNHDGVVYEKDLGSRTADRAQGMQRFDPDSSWKAEGDPS